MEKLMPAVRPDPFRPDRAAPIAMKGVLRSFEIGDHLDRPSVHKAHELTYVRRGEIHYLIQGKEYVLRKGDLFVIKPNVEHCYAVADGPLEMVIVYFAFTRHAFQTEGPEAGRVSVTSIDQFVRFTEESEGEKQKTQTQAAAKTGQNEPGLFLRGHGHEKIAALAERVVRESDGQEFARNLMLDALAVELVVLVARNLKAAWEETLRVKQGKARELVLIARDFIDSHYAEAISVADAANYVFLSQGYFARAFREEMKMSPMAYLIHVRVQQACKLLKQPDLKVSAIASRVGFSSPQRFNAAFRKQMNMTPMEYRKKKGRTYEL